MEQGIDDAEVAGRGRPAEQAENLLHRAMRLGVSTLAEIASAAIRRLVRNDRQALGVVSLFTRSELDQLAAALAATNATSNLLGRAHIRRRLQIVKDSVSEGRITEADANPTAIDRAGPKPIAPEKAVSYFRRLVPSLEKDPQRFGDLFRREAFTLAVATDQELLKRVKGLIQDRLETGVSFRDAPKEIDRLINDAGVSPSNSGYSKMVFRTNAVDAYNVGSQEELNDPDVKDFFPVWQWLTITDGRQRDAHDELNGLYFPNGTSFTQVRDRKKGSFDGFNCRCAFRAIDKYEWADLEKGGAKVEAS